MSNADRDPHLLISARLAYHRKLIELPNDRARWGWIVTLGEAKLQRPPGRFASIRVLHALAGRYKEYVDDYIEGRLLHPAPVARTCSRCASAFPDLADDEIVVHDWKEHQERTSRTSEWRRNNGVPNGHGNLSGNTGETSGETPGKPLAGAGAVSQSLSQSDSPTEGASGEDPVVAYASLSGSYPSPKAMDWIDQLTEEYGHVAVIRALAVARKGGANGVIGRARDVLRAEARQLSQRDKAAEQAKVKARRVDGMLARRLEWYRNTGQWDPAWGEVPA